MDASAASTPSRSPTPASLNLSPVLPSENQLKPSWVHFQAAYAVILLREDVAVEHPFARGSACREDIAGTLQKEFLGKFKIQAFPMSPVSFRMRSKLRLRNWNRLN